MWSRGWNRENSKSSGISLPGGRAKFRQRSAETAMKRGKQDTPGPFTAMKTMKLYDQVERINNEIEALGLGADGPLKVEDLTAFDQYHYLGTSAVDHAIESLGIGAGSRVLEIGSGIGGPARYVAQRTGAHVSALELQSDLHRTAERL